MVRSVHLKCGLAVAAVLVLVLAVVLVVELGDDTSPDAGPGRAGGLPTESLDSVTPSFGPSVAAAKGRTVRLPSGKTLTFAAQGGSGFVITPAKSYTLTLTARSSQPIGTLGYLVPTSEDASRGVIKNVGTSWTLTTKVTGRPNYAILFVQSGASGAAISCSVRIDGRVADARTTGGAYSRQVCYA